LGKGLFTNATEVMTILDRVGLRSLHWTTFRATSEQLGAIDRSYDVNFSVPDISYFVGAPISTIHSIFRRSKKRTGKARSVVASYSKRGKGGFYLSRGVLSEVYEAQDLTSLGDSDIAESLDLPEPAIAFARDKRAHISEDIMQSLSTIYPDKEISQPYLSE
jgi:hypothetical protein|tara:strand:- start:6898 stop:7383 length:486 start_codon:yes stop_codon:yes gene_type:complete